MIKRIFIVAFLTGFSQMLSLVSVGFLKSLDQSLVYDIGNYESLIVIFTSIIALGLQLVTVRDIALNDKWQQILIKSQRERFTFSVFILIVVIFIDLFFNKIEFESILFYLVIPLIALNSDYSFYGIGQPEKGSILSFLRVAILSLFIILSVLFDNPYIKITYIITVLLTYLCVGLLSSHFNKQPYLVYPVKDFHKSYLKSINVGIASFALVFFGLGLVSFASFFYTEQAVANAYLLLKIYVFYVGIKRLLVQILFKELKNPELAKVVDQIGIIVGITVVILLYYYPELSIKFFTKDYQVAYKSLMYLLPAILFTSLSFAGPLELLLNGKDKIYSIGFILGAVIVLLSTYLLSYLDSNNEGYIYLAISIGELVAILIIGWGVDGFRFFRNKLSFAFLAFVILYGLNFLLLMISLKIFALIIIFFIVSIYILYTIQVKINKF
jgi:hypothetical protein